MKGFIFLSIILHSALGLAGGMPVLFPTYRYECSGEGVNAFYMSGTFMISLSPRSDFVQELAQRGWIVRGYAHNAGFMTEDLDLDVSGMAIMDNLHGIRQSVVPPTAKIFNNGDYGRGTVRREPDRDTKLVYSLMGTQVHDLTLKAQVIVVPVYRCLVPNDNPYTACPERELVKPGFVLEEVVTTLDLGVCKAVRR